MPLRSPQTGPPRGACPLAHTRNSQQQEREYQPTVSARSLSTILLQPQISDEPLSPCSLVGLGVHQPHTCSLPRVSVLDLSKPIKMQGCCSQCRVVRVQQAIFRLRSAEIHKRQLATGCTEYPKGKSQRKEKIGGRHYAGCKPTRVALWADNSRPISDSGLVQGVI